MKSLYLRSSVALACALSLSACGGGGGTLVLSGGVTGLNRDGLVLQNNLGTPLPIVSPYSYFQFPELIGNDTAFNITIQSQPAKVQCSVINGKGTTAAFNPINIVVSCITESYELSGSVSGLTTDGLVVINGNNRQSVPAGATSFSMNHYNAEGAYVSGKVMDGSPYGLTVLTQPAGATCSVINGVGIPTAKPENIQIQCVANAATN